MATFTLNALVQFLQDKNFLQERLTHLPNITLNGFSPLNSPRPSTLVWTRVSHLENPLPPFSSIVLLAPPDFDSSQETNVVLKVKQPRLAFAHTLQYFAAPFEKRGLEDTVKIGRNCQLGENIYLGHYVILGDNVSIGDNTVIHSHTSIYERVRIGQNCLIHSGVVIGAEGFGYEKDECGTHFRLPHVGSVLIGNHVEIGANTCIDRGTLGDTVIQDHVKIDNLCHIAHNVVVKENSMVIALAMIGGSTVIGNNTWVAPGAILRDGLKIGENAVVGLGAVVLKDVEATDTVVGNPARILQKRPFNNT